MDIDYNNFSFCNACILTNEHLALIFDRPSINFYMSRDLHDSKQHQHQPHPRSTNPCVAGGCLMIDMDHSGLGQLCSRSALYRMESDKQNILHEICGLLKSSNDAVLQMNGTNGKYDTDDPNDVKLPNELTNEPPHELPNDLNIALNHGLKIKIHWFQEVIMRELPHLADLLFKINRDPQLEFYVNYVRQAWLLETTRDYKTMLLMQSTKYANESFSNPPTLLHFAIDSLWSEQVNFIPFRTNLIIKMIRSMSDQMLSLRCQGCSVLTKAYFNLYRMNRAVQNGAYIVKIIEELWTRVPIDGGLASEGVGLFCYRNPALIRSYELQQDRGLDATFASVARKHNSLISKTKHYVLNIRSRITQTFGSELMLRCHGSTSTKLIHQILQWVCDFVLPIENMDVPGFFPRASKYYSDDKSMTQLCRFHKQICWKTDLCQASVGWTGQSDIIKPIYPLSQETFITQEKDNENTSTVYGALLLKSQKENKIQRLILARQTKFARSASCG